jgi:hypothetical protein
MEMYRWNFSLHKSLSLVLAADGLPPYSAALFKQNSKRRAKEAQLPDVYLFAIFERRLVAK